MLHACAVYITIQLKTRVQAHWQERCTATAPSRTCGALMSAVLWAHVDVADETHVAARAAPPWRTSLSSCDIGLAGAKAMGRMLSVNRVIRRLR